MKSKKSMLDRFAVACLNAIIFLLVFLLLGAFLYAVKPETFFRAHDELTYSVRFTIEREEFTRVLHEGDRVLDAVRKNDIGTVVAYDLSPALTETYSQKENRMRMVEYPQRVTLTLTIRAPARHTEKGYSVAGRRLAVGQKLALRLPNFVGEGTVAAIEIK